MQWFRVNVKLSNSKQIKLKDGVENELSVKFKLTNNIYDAKVQESPYHLFWKVEKVVKIITPLI